MIYYDNEPNNKLNVAVVRFYQLSTSEIVPLNCDVTVEQYHEYV